MDKKGYVLKKIGRYIMWEERKQGVGQLEGFYVKRRMRLVSLVGALSKEKHTFYKRAYQNSYRQSEKNELLFPVPGEGRETEEKNEKKVDGEFVNIFKEHQREKKENLRDTFSRLVAEFAVETRERVETGYHGPGIQTGAGSYTENEWKRLIRRFDAVERKLTESMEKNARESDIRKSGSKMRTSGRSAAEEKGEKETTILEEMLAEVAEEEKKPEADRFAKTPDMLLLTYTKAVYPSEEKQKKDTVYYTFYDKDGIYCKKAGQSGIEWKIPIEDEAQYDKIMDYLKQFEGRFGKCFYPLF